MSDLVYPAIPTGTIVKQPGSLLTTNRDGTATLTDTYKGNFEDFFGSSLIVSGTAHGSFTGLQVWTNKLTEDKAGIGTLVVEYRGSNGTLPEAEYTLDRTTHNEPLSTHPKWATGIAGTPDAPLHGAIFVDPITGTVSTGGNAVFKGWTTGSEFEGVEDYLVAGTTFTSSYASADAPDLTGVGQIQSSTPTGAPTAPDGFYWIYQGASYTQHGPVYRIQETYLLTGGLSTHTTNIIYGTDPGTSD